MKFDIPWEQLPTFSKENVEKYNFFTRKYVFYALAYCLTHSDDTIRIDIQFDCVSTPEENEGSMNKFGREMKAADQIKDGRKKNPVQVNKHLSNLPSSTEDLPAFNCSNTSSSSTCILFVGAMFSISSSCNVKTYHQQSTNVACNIA